MEERGLVLFSILKQLKTGGHRWDNDSQGIEHQTGKVSCPWETQTNELGSKSAPAYVMGGVQAVALRGAPSEARRSSWVEEVAMGDEGQVSLSSQGRQHEKRKLPQEKIPEMLRAPSSSSRTLIIKYKWLNHPCLGKEWPKWKKNHPPESPQKGRKAILSAIVKNSTIRGAPGRPFNCLHQ